MTLRAPKYYKKFKCIADKCSHSCCIGWEIDIDEAALSIYRGTEIENSISYEEVPHFVLTDNGRCPHLDGRGLCRLICKYGDGILCDICREHPRFYHDTLHGREVGLGMSCEEACRIILESDDYAEFITVGEADGARGVRFDACAQRSRVYEILGSGLTYIEKVALIKERFGVRGLERDEARALLSSLEYLEEDHRALLLNYSPKSKPSANIEKAIERAFAYFVFRHCSGAEDETDFRSSLGLAVFCAELLFSLSNADNIADIARMISEEIEYSEENTEAIKFEFAF